MIKNPKIIERFERSDLLKKNCGLKEKLKLMDAMYKHALKFHDFTKDDFSVRDIEHLIRCSKAFKSIKKRAKCEH